MPNIFRAYTPTVQTVQNLFFQQSLTVAQSNPVLKGAVNPILPHRKVWAILHSLTAGAIINWDLVATANGREVLRVQMARFNGATFLYRLGYNALTTNIGGINEILTINLAGTTFYSVAPLRLNIAADTFFIDSSNQAGGGVSGAGSLWDGYLFVMSQAGI